MDMVAVIMAGGTGTRFWPMSRAKRPKQVLSIGDLPVLLTDTIRRLRRVVDPGRIFVITSREHLGAVRDAAGDLPEDRIVAEPEGRNTAACAGLGGLLARERFGPGTVIGTFPADHRIGDEERFHSATATAVEAVNRLGGIVTLGIQPTHPATGYGYIQYESERYEPFDETRVFPVVRFTEKPDAPRAESFLEKGNYVWNSGMFFWTARHILSEIRRYMPRLSEGLEDIARRWEETGDLPGSLDRFYGNLPAQSVDYGVLEKTDTIWTVPVDFDWNDLGSWDTLEQVLPTDENGNVRLGTVVEKDTENAVLVSGDQRLIGTVGVSDLVVVATDDAVLVCPKQRAEDVKKLVEKLQKEGREEYL